MKSTDEFGTPNPERRFEAVDDVIAEFRKSVHASAERPAFFWTRQRASIMARIKPARPARQRLKPLLVPVALAVFLCLFFFAKSSKAPTPDMPAGADHILLIEVERALSRPYPDAFAPAAEIRLEFETHELKK